MTERVVAARAVGEAEQDRGRARRIPAGRSSPVRQQGRLTRGGPMAGRSACPGPACWPICGLSPARVCTHRPRRRQMRGSVLRTGCPGRRPGFPYRDHGISRFSAGSSGNAARPGTLCRMRIWRRSHLSTASPLSPRIRISPGSPASHGSIPSQPQPRMGENSDGERPGDSEQKHGHPAVDGRVSVQLTISRRSANSHWPSCLTNSSR